MLCNYSLACVTQSILSPKTKRALKTINFNRDEKQTKLHLVYWSL